jgi:hypothetical protein
MIPAPVFKIFCADSFAGSEHDRGVPSFSVATIGCINLDYLKNAVDLKR